MMFLRGALYVIFFVSASAFTTLPTTPMAVVRPRSLCASADALTRVKASTSNRGDHAIRGVLLPPKPFQAVRALVTSGLLAACLVLLSHPLPATAADGARVVGEFQGSGLVFKDTLKVESFDDPKIKGVTLYISNFERPLTERLSSNFFADPSDASVGCARTGPVAVADNIARGSKGEEVFEESRSLLFKSLRVRRIFDEDKKTAIYVSYNTRLDKNDDSNKSRFKSSLCVVSLEDYAKP